MDEPTKEEEKETGTRLQTFILIFITLLIIILVSVSLFKHYESHVSNAYFIVQIIFDCENNRLKSTVNYFK